MERPTRIGLVCKPWQGFIIPLYHGREIGRAMGHDATLVYLVAETRYDMLEPAKGIEPLSFRFITPDALSLS